MSSDEAIVVEGLSKAYLIYADPVYRLWQALVPRAQSVVQPLASLLGISLRERSYFTKFWALRDVSFRVKRGESIAIIGRNGSGKSTLLKLVCGTLTPTGGTSSVHGKVAAILELGSGFNPEFTGRENVLLNANILGLKREEAEARLDDILAFAEIGEFVDQPVKTYSTGMVMRLAFAVIAHVDAEILIIDEALAVGDAYFSQKCLRWLRRFRERGTILFCGHDTGAVMSLCDRAIWIDKGNLVLEGTAKDVCEAYSASIMSQATGSADPAMPPVKPLAAENDGQPTAPDPSPIEAFAPPVRRPKVALPLPPEDHSAAVFNALTESASFGSGQAEIYEVSLTDPDGQRPSWIEGGEHLLITARINIKAETYAPIAGFIIKDRLGQPLLGDNTFLRYASAPLLCRPCDRLEARFGFRLPNLSTGRYSITLALASGTPEEHVQHHWLHDAIFFDVHSPFRNGVMIAMEMAEMSLTQMVPAAGGELI
ncbi:ABC transporter ATP-binding protein [Bradyrhizobium barranii]|uniref:ABC transporter ATP-binding protein n=1 Tax=Bradyrhizobium barranii TaxID=2992140 RepID=UPI00403384BF